MALAPRQFVNLIRLLDDSDQVGNVSQFPLVQHQAQIAHVRILGEVIDSDRLEAAAPAFDAVHRVALLEQQFGQVAAV